MRICFIFQNNILRVYFWYISYVFRCLERIWKHSKSCKLWFWWQVLQCCVKLTPFRKAESLLRRTYVCYHRMLGHVTVFILDGITMPRNSSVCSLSMVVAMATTIISKHLKNAWQHALYKRIWMLFHNWTSKDLDSIN